MGNKFVDRGNQVAYFVAVTITDAPVSKKRIRGKRTKGICAAAHDLAVSRQHLWAVLNKHRESKPLMARFRAWKRERATPTPTKQTIT